MLRHSVLAGLDAARALTGAEMANVQLYEPGGGVLKIEAQRGFSAPFPRIFRGGSPWKGGMQSQYVRVAGNAPGHGARAKASSVFSR